MEVGFCKFLLCICRGNPRIPFVTFLKCVFYFYLFKLKYFLFLFYINRLSWSGRSRERSQVTLMLIASECWLVSGSCTGLEVWGTSPPPLLLVQHANTLLKIFILCKKSKLTASFLPAAHPLIVLLDTAKPPGSSLDLRLGPVVPSQRLLFWQQSSP